MSSWAIVQLRPDTIEVEIVFAPSEAFLLIRDAATQIKGITYDNFPFVKSMLVSQAPSLLTFSVDERPVAPQKTTVTLTPEDDLEFVLTFPRPKPGVVGFDAQFLNRVSPEHMTYLSVIAEDGTFLAGSEPIVGETMTFVDLPPPQQPAPETQSAQQTPKQTSS